MTVAEFLQDVSSVEGSINTVQGNIDRIKTIQSQILGSTSLQQESSYGDERNAIFAETKELLFEIKDRIKKIERENARLSMTNTDIHLRKQRSEFLRDKFTRVLEDYRSAEDNYMKQQKERMLRQFRVVNPDASQEEIDEYLANPSGQPVFQQALTRTDKAKDALAYVKQRHDDIKMIEQTIGELATLFRELQLEIETQDTVLAEVEESVVETAVKIEKGN